MVSGRMELFIVQCLLAQEPLDGFIRSKYRQRCTESANDLSVWGGTVNNLQF